MRATSAQGGVHYLEAEIVWLALRVKKFDSDVIERAAGVGARYVREAAAGVTNLAVGHDETGLGLAGDSVDDVRGTKAHVNVRQVVLMEKRGVVRGDADAEDADVVISKDQMVMRFLPDRNGDGSLGGERGREQECESNDLAFHERIVSQLDEPRAKARAIGWTTTPKR